jgi:hypothetical protein
MAKVKIDNVEKLLTLEQESFCNLFASDKEFFGNGVQSYIEAYNVDLSKPNAYKSAMASASRLLTNVKITKRINEIFEARGLNDCFVDKQLEKLITQDADFKSKMSAIKEYNTLKKRVIMNPQVSITNYTDEQIKSIASRINSAG